MDENANWNQFIDFSKQVSSIPEIEEIIRELELNHVLAKYFVLFWSYLPHLLPVKDHFIQ